MGQGQTVGLLVCDGKGLGSTVRIVIQGSSFLPLEWENGVWGGVFEKYLEDKKGKS